MFEYKPNMYDIVAVITQYEKPMKFIVTIGGETQELDIKLYWDEEIPSRGKKKGKTKRKLTCFVIEDDAFYADELDMPVKRELRDAIEEWMHLAPPFEIFDYKSSSEVDKMLKPDIDGIFDKVWKYITELKIV